MTGIFLATTQLLHCLQWLVGYKLIVLYEFETEGISVYPFIQVLCSLVQSASIKLEGRAASLRLT